MAMDKDRLLQYFQQHYLSRQEVLFKLPLNVSIDTFWPELLNRRKAGATILPLSNAAGMPYWYVLTEKMIAASERLCAEAMEQEECFDPYRAPMTSAMTEEMFFTSFVEGAQSTEACPWKSGSGHHCRRSGCRKSSPGWPEECLPSSW